MSQGNDLSNYSPADASGADDVWFVAVASDDIRQMSVDQLDEALNSGVITADTAVWQDGMDAWATLGEVAGLDEDDADDHAETRVAGTDYGRPMAASDYAAAGHAAAGHAAAGHAAAGGHASSMAEPAPHSMLPADPGQPSIVPAQFSGAQSSAPRSVAPRSAGAHGVAAGAHSSLAPVAGPTSGAFGQSTVPVALNVDEEMPPIRTGRRFKPERWLLAVAGIAAVGVTAYNNDVFSSAATPTAQASDGASTFAAQPYEASGVDKGKQLAATSGAAEGGAAEPAAAKAAPETVADSAGAPIGSAVGGGSDEAKAEPKKSLRGSSSLSRSFKPKSKAKKPRKQAARSRKAAPRRAARSSNKSAAAKKPKVKRAASAFDPLNASLP